MITSIKLYKAIKEAIKSDDNMMMMLSVGEKPEVLNGDEWYIDSIIDVIQDPKDIEKYDKIANEVSTSATNITTDIQYKTVSTGDTLWLTALLKPKNRNTNLSIGEMGVVKVKVMQVYYGLNKLNQLKQQGKL